MERDELAFDWMSLVPRLLHPIKVAIIEALCWIGTPLSASELERMFDRSFGTNLVSYHLVGLAKVEVTTLVGERQVRGARQLFYFFPVPQIPAHPAFGDLA